VSKDDCCADCGHWKVGHTEYPPPLSCCECPAFVDVAETGGIRLYLCRCGHYRDRHDANGRCVEPCGCSGFERRDGARGGVS
jgi:hypothetical protein